MQVTVMNILETLNHKHILEMSQKGFIMEWQLICSTIGWNSPLASQATGGCCGYTGQDGLWATEVTCRNKF